MAPRGARARRPRRGATRPRRPRPHRPARRRRAARQTAGQSPPVAPLRDSPVSILRWTRARRSAIPAAASTIAAICSRRLGGDVDVGGDQRGRSSSGPYSQASSGRVSPASRRASASAGVATPSQSAPASRAARAHCDHPVAVRVGLDHDHQRGRGDVRTERVDVGRGRRPGRSQRRRRQRVDGRTRLRRSWTERTPPIDRGRLHRASSCGGSGPGNGRARGHRLHRGREHRRGSGAPTPGRQHGGAEATEHVAGAGLPGPGRARAPRPRRLAARCAPPAGSPP